MNEHHAEDQAIGHFDGVVVSIETITFRANLTGIDGMIEMQGVEIALERVPAEQTARVRPGAKFRMHGHPNGHVVEFHEG